MNGEANVKLGKIVKSTPCKVMLDFPNCILKTMSMNSEGNGPHHPLYKVTEEGTLPEQFLALFELHNFDIKQYPWLKRNVNSLEKLQRQRTVSTLLEGLNCLQTRELKKTELRSMVSELLALRDYHHALTGDS